MKFIIMSIVSMVDRVTWVETDTAGVVHFSNYFRYCEKLEEILLNKIGIDFMKIIENYNIWFPRVSAKCEYRYPLRYNQKYRIELINVTLGNRSIHYNYRIWNLDEDKLSAECTIVVACVDRSLNKAVEIPSDIRKIFSKILSK